MRTETAVKLCNEFGLTAEDVRVSTAVQVTLGEKGDSTNETVEQAISHAERLLGQRGFVNAMRWALWVKHAKDNETVGRDFDELMQLRRGDFDESKEG
jgi:hypothetical protein